jgi:tRNA 2-thiouridine synthesizing protein E
LGCFFGSKVPNRGTAGTLRHEVSYLLSFINLIERMRSWSSAESIWRFTVNTVSFKGKTFAVDAEGFLLDPGEWDEAFAEGTASSVGISQNLGKRHWDVIHFIRKEYREKDRCPLLYETCRQNGLSLKELEDLFPAGYLRGACRLAGCTYSESYAGHYYDLASKSVSPLPVKTYEVDVRGFLMNADQWDEQFAAFKAYEMKMPGPLGKSHWRIISYLRASFKRNGIVPNVYETSRVNRISAGDLERLFPDGYHRGAIKIAGLRVR